MKGERINRLWAVVDEDGVIDHDTLSDSKHRAMQHWLTYNKRGGAKCVLVKVERENNGYGWSKWYNHFAWWPRKSYAGQWHWLRWVERRDFTHEPIWGVSPDGMSQYRRG